MKRIKPFIASMLIFVLAVSIGLQYNSLSVQQASSCGCEVPCWCSAIMEDIEISGLTKDGEGQTVQYIGMGGWNSYDVCLFLVWRWHNGGTRDLQAHIELAKISDRIYKMEIYHSWKTPTVSMPTGSSQGESSDAVAPASGPKTRPCTRSMAYTPTLVMMANKAAAGALATA